MGRPRKDGEKTPGKRRKTNYNEHSAGPVADGRDSTQEGKNNMPVTAEAFQEEGIPLTVKTAKQAVKPTQGETVHLTASAFATTCTHVILLLLLKIMMYRLLTSL